MGKKALTDNETGRHFQAQVVSCHGRHHFVRDSLGHIYEAHRRGKKGDVVVGDIVQCLSSFDNTAAIVRPVSPTLILAPGGSFI